MNIVAAHLLNGRLVKGTTLDAGPARPVCHVRTDAGVVETIRLVDCKALFFLKNLAGDPDRKDDQVEDPSDPRRAGAQRIEVTFRDGEKVLGFIAGYPPKQKFYFIQPIDRGSNNLRILINGAAVVAMRSPTA